MHPRIRKIIGWVLGAFGFVFGIAKPLADWIGRSTIVDDASGLVRMMNPILEFLQRQPDLWFYGFQAALIAVGLTLVFWGKISHALWGEAESETAAIEPPKEKPLVLPKTVEELSKSDFSECMKISKNLTVKGALTEGTVHLCINWKSHSKFLVVYLPHTEHAFGAISELAIEGPKLVPNFADGMQVFSKDPGDISDVDMAAIPFVNRVVVYHESRIPLQEAAQLTEIYQQQSLNLVLRGSDYASARWLTERASEKTE